MLNKIGYIKEIAFDALREHLLSLNDRYEYYFASKTQQYGYKAGISDDCLSAIAKEHQEYSREASRWVCTLGDFDAVTEWKQAHAVRKFTEWQAKRFARRELKVEQRYK